MDRSHPCLRLDVIITPSADITRLWNTFRPVDRAFLRLIIGDLPLLANSLINWTLLRTAISFWDTQRAVFSFQGSELAPTVEEYATLIQRPMPTRDIVVPNQFATIQSRLAILLDLRDEEIRHELQHGWEHNVKTTWLIDFIHVRSLNARGESYQRDAYHGFLLLIFETILFPYSSNLIDGALAQVILQVIWLLAHIRPFCSSHPFSYITDERSLIARLLQVFRPSDRDYTDWIQFFKRLTPAQFLWAARWNPGGPMTIGCPSVIGLPLISHLGSTLVFPARVIRQLGGLQDIPIEADRTPYRFVWTNIIALLPDRVLRIREVRRLWGTRTIQELYFPEHPTDDERAFSATVLTTGVPSISNSCKRKDAHSGIPIGHPPQTAQTTSNFVNPARFTALEGMVNHLVTNMATNMTELMVMLTNQNQASSSFTPPSEHRPIVDPNPIVLPTFVSEERRMKRMEETIRALQAGTSRLDFGDSDWNLFPGMLLPPKIKIPNFKRYDGTTDPRHHLRHYHSKMLSPTSHSRPIHRPRQLLSSHNLRNSTLLLRLNKKDLRLRDLLSRLNDRIQEMIDERQIFFNEVKQPNECANPLPNHGSAYALLKKRRRHKNPFVIEIPAKEPYQDRRVPWNYGGEVANTEQELSAMAIMRSGRVYQGPELTDKGKAPAVTSSTTLEVAPLRAKKVTDQEAEDFMKVIKASEYKVVEQMSKSPAHISLLSLLLSSEPHRNALLKILEIPNAFSLLLGRPWIHAAGAVPSSLHQKLKFFVEGKLITVNSEEDYEVYKETVVPYISIGEDQNLPFHSFDAISVIRHCGEVGLSRTDLMIGKVLLKNDYVPRTGLGARAQGILRPIEMEEYRNRRGLGFRPSYHEIVQARRGKHLHRLAAHYGKLFRGIPVPPLSQFFVAPPQIMGGISDSPITEIDDFSSDAVEAFLALPAIYAVTEETSSRVHIRHVREDEELTNWTLVPLYSAIVADV
ncbi:hypothetical protein CRG98_009942 [Punica granatum]|uniref:G-patch domain-containing protein n=1 Tax=Punica granatum TaxID=22663 RepID=A0A2I0KMF8_PUNGR|nr:hypothetical protein CRG98_009942 [Punica granatum]